MHTFCSTRPARHAAVLLIGLSLASGAVFASIVPRSVTATARDVRPNEGRVDPREVAVQSRRTAEMAARPRQAVAVTRPVVGIRLQVDHAATREFALKHFSPKWETGHAHQLKTLPAADVALSPLAPELAAPIDAFAHTAMEDSPAASALPALAPALIVASAPALTVPIAMRVLADARPEPLRVAIRSLSGEHVGRGQPLELTVSSNRTAHIHCYLRDERKLVRRIFPQPGRADTLVQAGEVVTLSGNGGFQLTSSARGITEAVVCYATEQAVLAALPQRLRAPTFEPLPIANVEALRLAFSAASDQAIAEGVFYIRAQ